MLRDRSDSFVSGMPVHTDEEMSHASDVEMSPQVQVAHLSTPVSFVLDCFCALSCVCMWRCGGKRRGGLHTLLFYSFLHAFMVKEIS